MTTYDPSCTSSVGFWLIDAPKPYCDLCFDILKYDQYPDILNCNPNWEEEYRLGYNIVSYPVLNLVNMGGSLLDSYIFY